MSEQQKQRIVLASSNKGKIREYAGMMADLPYEVVPQSAYDVPDADETGLTFIENAILKARNAAELANLPAMADDSGVCINALNGAPGIYSARYAGPGAKDADLVNKVLSEMKDVPDDQRQAQFHCVIALLRSPTDPDPIIAHGVWHGTIVHQAEGTHGFGYDPILFLEEHNCTAAELPTELKNKLSHRGQALRQLLKLLELNIAQSKDSM